jgi:hypothetical protein
MNIIACSVTKLADLEVDLLVGGGAILRDSFGNLRLP